MKAGRARAKPDDNQTHLVKFIRKLGASWQHTHTIPGALDGIIGWRGIDQRVEIKNPDQTPAKRRLTDAEKETFDTWKGRRPVVIETQADVLQLIQILNKESINGKT